MAAPFLSSNALNISSCILQGALGMQTFWQSHHSTEGVLAAYQQLK